MTEHHHESGSTPPGETPLEPVDTKAPEDKPGFPPPEHEDGQESDQVEPKPDLDDDPER